jgi:hypothetical protein
MTTTINSHIGLKGVFHFKLTNTISGEVREYEFTNLILDSGLNKLPYGGFVTGCLLGGDTNTPLATDTEITNIQTGVVTPQTHGVGAANISNSPYWSSYYWTFHVPTSTNILDNFYIRQVAVGWGVAAILEPEEPGSEYYKLVYIYEGLFSLALVKDTNGNPTTIVKYNEDTLDITYTLQVNCPTADVVSTVIIGGLEYSYTIRPASAGNWFANGPLTSNNTAYAYPASSVLGTPTGVPSGSGLVRSSTVLSSYTNNTYTRDVQLEWDLNYGNAVGGIRCVYIDVGSKWQISYSAVIGAATIPKDSDKRLTLNVRFSWGRA